MPTSIVGREKTKLAHPFQTGKLLSLVFLDYSAAVLEVWLQIAKKSMVHCPGYILDKAVIIFFRSSINCRVVADSNTQNLQSGGVPA